MHRSYPRPRFTVRRLMFAVAIVAFLFGMADRSRRFSAIAGLYSQRSQASVTTPDQVRRRARWNAYRVAMYRKYRRAARYPWLPVEPDPLPPERITGSP